MPTARAGRPTRTDAGPSRWRLDDVGDGVDRERGVGRAQLPLEGSIRQHAHRARGRARPLQERLQVVDQNVVVRGYRRADGLLDTRDREVHELVLGCGVPVEVRVGDAGLSGDLPDADLLPGVATSRRTVASDQILEAGAGLVAGRSLAGLEVAVPREDLLTGPQPAAPAARGGPAGGEVEVAAAVGRDAVAVGEPEDAGDLPGVDQGAEFLGGGGGHGVSLVM